MTTLLERAVAEIKKLPEDMQDAIAARLLKDLADEQAWAARFAATTDTQWQRMAAMARQEVTIDLFGADWNWLPGVGTARG